MAGKRFVLVHRRAPGDITCLTALPRDIHAAHPGRCELFVDTTCRDLWANNPYVTLIPPKTCPPGGTVLSLNYGKGLREQKAETVHFCSYFHRDFHRQTGIDVPMTRPFGDFHFTEEEHPPLVSGRYWCVISGGKSDFTAKVWEAKKFQAVVDGLLAAGIGVVQLGDTARGHSHPLLDGALNLVGQTSLRDMLRVIRDSDGVVCGVTGAMHMAAALQRPCVALAGGREAWWWEAYVRENRGLGGPAIAAKLRVPHRYLHTIGLLDCCPTHGCWRNKVLPVNGDPSICKFPVHRPGQAVPKCLDMITVDMVLTAVLSYYYDGTLPTIPGPLEDEIKKMYQMPQAETAYRVLSPQAGAPPLPAAGL